MKNYTITISREFASMGRSIAQRMSELLGIEYYDRDIVEAAAKRMGLPVSVISDHEENVPARFYQRQYPLGNGQLYIQDDLFMVQKNIIQDLAAKGPCIIVGRCADTIFKDHENSLNIFVYAPYPERMKNCRELLNMDEKTAAKMIKNVDKARNAYRQRYCPDAGAVTDHRDILIDSSRFGIEGTAQILTGIARELFLK